MKQSIFPSASQFAVVALFSIIAFFAGRITGTSPTGTGPTNSSSERTSGSIRQVYVDVPSSSGAFVPATPASALTSDEVRARTFEVLSLPNRVERLRQLCELLRNVNGDNWHSMTDAFTRVVTTTGRRNRDELSLILERIGAVAGQAAVEEALQSEKSYEKKRMPELLTGWALADPKAAMTWVAAQPAEQQAELIPPLIDGMALSEPLSALSVVSNDLSDIRDNLVPQIVGGIIQQGGFRAVDDLLSRFPGSANIVAPVQGTVFWEAAVRQIEAARLRGEPQAILDWADPYVTGDFKGPASMKEIISCAAKADASATIRWVMDRHGKLAPEQEAVAFPIIAREMLVQDPQKLTEWMSTNPDHPRRDSVAQTVAQQLLKDGRLEEARQWGQTIKNPTTRQSVENNILKAEQKRGSVTPAP